MRYASGVMIYIPSFTKIGSTIHSLIGGMRRDTDSMKIASFLRLIFLVGIFFFCQFVLFLEIQGEGLRCPYGWAHGYVGLSCNKNCRLVCDVFVIWENVPMFRRNLRLFLQSRRVRPHVVWYNFAEGFREPMPPSSGSKRKAPHTPRP
jgi:hypothetical protein